uniref:Phosphoenolpyruvate kinase n=1 Tax=Eiseniibacteriota bacterium TaxID=2212470 RepID=A0A832I0H0_UNCEI
MDTIERDAAFRDVLARLDASGARGAAAYSPARPARQPVHVVYGGAHLFRADVAARLGEAARRALETYAPEPASFAHALGLPGDEAFHRAVFERTVARLEREPVEDYRVDFEDGFGPRPDAEEDAAAARVAEELARGLAAGSLPAACGVRVRALRPATAARALRTLDAVVGGAAAAAGGRLPDGFAVTLPKVERPAEVEALAAALDRIEARAGLARGTVAVELMLETPRALLDDAGRVALPALVAAGGGRVRGVHLGPFDLTAALGVPPAHQGAGHPACELARGLAQVALAGTGVALADGPTMLLPVGPHRAPPGAGPLGLTALDENRAAVHRGWRAHAADVRAALARGIPQGWDLHPAQLVSRHATVIAFHREELPAAAARLRAFVAGAARAVRTGATFDDAATGAALAAFFARGLACGALDDADAAATGLPAAALRAGTLEALLAAAGAAAPGGAENAR